MTRRESSSSPQIDPFDIEWVVEDPLSRDVIMSKSIIKARESAGKHPFPPEHLDVFDVKEVVSDPDFIEPSISKPKRDVYYKVISSEPHPFSRVVVDFSKDAERGIAISWSRYKHTAQSTGRKWEKDGKC